MAQVKAENPGLSEADLMVQVTDRVKRAETARRGRAAERLNEFPYEMLGDQLVNRPGFLGVAPPPPRAAAQPARYVDHFLPNVEEIDYPPPFDYEDEEGQGNVEPAPEDPNVEELRPQPHQQHPHQAHRYPFRYPAPPGYMFDRRYGIFFEPRHGIWFDPRNAQFYDIALNLGYDGRTRQYFPIIPHGRDHRHCQHQRCQCLHPNFHY